MTDKIFKEGRFKSDEFIETLKKPAKLSGKFKDSLLKELAKGNTFQKPVVYVFILEWSKLDVAQRRKTFEDIRSTIPKFKEDCYPMIKSVACAPIYSISDFVETFPMFDVIIDTNEVDVELD